MLSVRTSVANIIEAADGLPIEIACINSPNETVVGGSTADLDALSAALSMAGHRTFKLKVAHAYHTRQMDALLDELVEQTQAIVYKKPSVPSFRLGMLKYCSR